jgi:hypothetical protein
MTSLIDILEPCLFLKDWNRRFIEEMDRNTFEMTRAYLISCFKDAGIIVIESEDVYEGA